MSTSLGVPVGQPLHGASFGQAVRRFFAGSVRFSGRASRSEFWWAYLFAFLVSIVASVPYWIVWGTLMARAVTSGGDRVTTDPQLAQDAVSLTVWLLVCGGILLLVSLALLLPMLAVMWRRLQDANFHGAIALATVVGFGIVPLIMCCFPSNPAGVQYDPQHRAQQAAACAQAGALGYAPSGALGDAPSGALGYAPAGALGYAPSGALDHAQPGYADAGYGGARYGQPGYAEPSHAQPGPMYGEPFTQPPASGEPPAAPGQPPAAHGQPPAAPGQPPAAPGQPPAAPGQPPASR